jgi:glycosyltransferase involved in cell wall biosynthesis
LWLPARISNRSHARETTIGLPTVSPTLFDPIKTLFRRRRPELSIVVVVYDMVREAPRTLLSLATPYQRGIEAHAYEVIVVDNGSPNPLGQAAVTSNGPNFRYHYIENAPPSPAHAVNLGASLARGELLGIMIDGARLVTPGLLANAGAAMRGFPGAAVTCPSWHLGPKRQQVSVTEGYDKAAEDELLKRICWPTKGYRLFEIAALAPTSAKGCFLSALESNSLFLKRSDFRALGGYEKAFDEPGGGLVNLDFFKRVCEHCDGRVVTLQGEGSFHQLHGGISTNTRLQENQIQVSRWKAQYQAIRGEPWVPPVYRPLLLGQTPPEAMSYIAESANQWLTTPPLGSD